MLKRMKSIGIVVMVGGGVAFTVSACAGISVAGGVVGGGLSLLGVLLLLIGLGLSQSGCKKDDEEVQICLSMVYDAGEDTDTDTETATGHPGTDSDSDTGYSVCLTMMPDTETESSAIIDSETNVSVCLSIASTDTDTGEMLGTDTETGVSVCLDISYPDSETEDTFETDSLQVCLDISYPDTETDDPDAGADTDSDEGNDSDTHVGPCLSPPLDTGADVCLSIIQMTAEPSAGSTNALPVLESGAQIYVDTAPNTEDRQDLIARLGEDGVLPNDVVARLTRKTGRDA